MATLSIIDDCGTLAYAETSDKLGIVEAATSLVNHLISWSEKDAETENLYSADDNEEHIEELINLQENIEDGEVDLTDQVWYRTKLGFSFTYDQ